MNRIRSWATMAIAACALLAWSAPAHAGRLFLFAESATCNGAAANCSKTYVTSSTLDQYAYMAGTNALFTTSTWPMAIPPDAAASTAFTFKVHYETPDTGVGKVCSFSLAVYAFPSGSDIGTINGTPGATVTATSASTTHSATKRYVTSASGSYSVWNNQAGAICSSSACLNDSAVLFAAVDTGATTASSCRIRMIEVIY